MSNAAGGRSNKGKVKSTESEVNCSSTQTPMVRFQDYNIKSNDESVTSSNASSIKLMEVVTNSAKI